MRAFITGDTHGGSDGGLTKFSSKNFPEGKNLTKDDVIIIAGDFGLIWDPPHNISRQEQYFIKWLADKPWTTLFVDGNHENHTRLDSLEQVDMFGSPVGKVNDSIYHLKRGYVYTIGERKIFTFGGAQSVDKMYRMPDVSWWEREEPNYSEMMRGINAIKETNNIDYIIAHECPSSIIGEMYSHHTDKYQLTDYLQEIVNITNFKHYYFGHHHQDRKINDKFTCLYRKIIEI